MIAGNGMLKLAKYSGLFALGRLLTARKVRILAYHGIWLGDGHFGNFLFMGKRTFARRMALLAAWGYPVISLTEAVASSNRDKLPKGATVITIDDGWQGTYAAMLPVLERWNFPATVYLTTFYCFNQAPVIGVALRYCLTVGAATQCRDVEMPDWNFGPFVLSSPEERERALSSALTTVAAMETDEEKQAFLAALCEELGVDHGSMVADRRFHLMSPAEVKDAAARGISFELHTHRHRHSRDGRDCLESEISANHSHILGLTGVAPRHFCYPSGQWSREMWPVLERRSIDSATTTAPGLVDSRSPLYALPRILDGEEVSELEFEAEMSGFLELTRKLRRFFEH